MKLELCTTESDAGYVDVNLHHSRCHAASMVNSMIALVSHSGLAEACCEASSAASLYEEHQPVASLVCMFVVDPPRCFLHTISLHSLEHDSHHGGLSF